MSDERPPGIDFSMAGQPMPGLQFTCPHCGHEFEQAVGMDDFTEVHGPDGEETWTTELDGRRDVEITVTWSTSYSVFDFGEP